MNLCMRQSVQERRVAVQLMQLRHEKDIIRRNRLAKEKQFEEARVKEFEESLDKEKVRSFCHPQLKLYTRCQGLLKIVTGSG